jgi:DNA-directed RNA polymerase specialized sigma24 family protein
MARLADQFDTASFEDTRATQLRRAGDGDLAALSRLIVRYHTPLKIYMLGVFPSLAPCAEELLQDFAQDKLLRDGWLRQYDPNRGRFRDFLKTSLRNYVLNWLRKGQRDKRFSSLDGLNEQDLARIELEISTRAEAADKAYDTQWLRVVVSETLTRMETDCRQQGAQRPRRQQAWDVFKRRVVEPAFQDAEPVSYKELVEQLGLRDVSEGTNLLLSAKRIFERKLFAVVAEHERGEKNIRAEVNELKRSLMRLARRQAG